MKKVVSIVMALTMLIAMSANAATYFSATDADGNTTYYNAVSGKVFWDLDFDDEKYTFENNTNLSYDGSVYSPNGILKYTSYARTKGKTSIGTVDTITNKQNGRSIILDASESPGDKEGESRMNQIQVESACDILVTEFDFAFNELPKANNNVVMRADLKYGYNNPSSSNYMAPLYLKPDGKLAIHNVNTSAELAPNTWYEFCEIINLKTGLAELYVDGALVGSMRIDNTYTYVCKLNATTGENANSNILYYDNVKVYAATTELGLAIKAEGGEYSVEGAPVTLNVTSYNDDIVARYEILSSTDGTNYSVYANAASAMATYKSYTTYYKAIAYDENDSVLGESQPVTLVTNVLKKPGIQYWNIDFDDNYTLKNGVIYKDGAAVTNPNGKRIDTNAAGNGVVKIDNPAEVTNNQNGKALILDNTNNSGNQVQLNELRMASVDSITVAEFDFAYNQTPENTNSIFRFEGTTSETGDDNRAFEAAGTMNLSKNDVIYMSSLAESTGIKVQPKKWYHITQVINLTEQKVDTYIDGKHLAIIDMNGAKVGSDKLPWKQIRRFSASTNSNCTNALYYDNFNIYSVDVLTDSELKIESVKYFINGEEVTNIADGNLTAEVILSNNNAENLDLQCIAAVYSAPGELDRVTVVPVSFDADEYSKLVNFNIGNVASTNVVKIFFWTVGGETNALVPNGVNGVLANQ